jgi:transposase
LSGVKLAAFNKKAVDGVTTSDLAKEFGVSYQVAYRYATMTRKMAQAASQAHHPSNAFPIG